MTLYHITPYIHLFSILKHGLIPCRGRGFAGLDHESSCVVWLTDSIEHIVTTQLTPEWIAEKSAVALSVEVKNFEPYIVAPCGHPIMIPHEFLHFGEIASDKVTIFRDCSSLLDIYRQ